MNIARALVVGGMMTAWLACDGAAVSLYAQAAAAASEPPVSLYGVVPNDPSTVAGAAAVEQARPAAIDTTHDVPRGEFVVAPLPMVNPTLDNGLALLVAYLYCIDRTDRT